MPAATLTTAWEDFEVPAHARGGQVTLNLYDHLASYLPKRPGAYLRISSDRFGLEAGVDRQLEDAEDSRTRLGWGPFAKIYRENDTSAFKKRKITKPDGTIDWVVLRPEFRQLLADLALGVIDGVIFYDLDRLVRQPRDLEDLIDIVEYVKRPVTGATGGRMNLINDSDRHMARMMCVMALKSSEDTARRVARQHLSAAQNGQVQGRIAYGWVRKGEHKGQLVPDEADLVTRIFQDFLAGESAYSLAKTFNSEGVQPPAAKTWSSTMVAKMLRNPRYAGMVSYAGRHRVNAVTAGDGWTLVLFDEQGRPLLGSWEPIISPKIWSQVQFELQRRRQKAGIKPGESGATPVVRYFLSGILRCNKCHRGLVGHRYKQRRTGKIIRNYECPPSDRGGCGGTAISAPTADLAVEEAMTAFLHKQLDCAKTELNQSAANVADLQAQLDQALSRKSDLIRRWSEGALQKIDVAEEDYFTMLAALNRKISMRREALEAAESTPVSTVPPEELLKNWTSGTLRQRRAIVKRYLHCIVVQPPAHRSKFNSPQAVKERLAPHWKTAVELAA
ncbi:recombinase family protein [Streptomyces noursei]|uniref:recombinase family protein n=1 Tax=Streptomyces noursei TaxID=1971 RepID=UPI0035DF639F